ncbi:MAG: hypothetical protein IIZ23_09560 [Ruminococcus sp.]|nr:hypothetical protein [Ruminococcus sp.]
MKRILIAMAATALALTSAFALAGCGSSESSKAESNSTVESKVEDVTKADNAQSAAAVTADDVKFTVNGATVELNSELETAVAGLGDPIEITSQLSCHGEGEDKTYTYDGYIVNSYPDANGTDRVLEVVVSAENLTTNKGIHVGSSASEVVEAYGKGYKEIGVYYSYDAGNKMELRFLIENDKVTEIDYYYNV